MAVPRNRLSNARKNSKRAHHAKKPVNTIDCPSCGTLKLSHTICASCGKYDGRVIIAMKDQS